MPTKKIVQRKRAAVRFSPLNEIMTPLEYDDAVTELAELELSRSRLQGAIARWESKILDGDDTEFRPRYYVEPEGRDRFGNATGWLVIDRREKRVIYGSSANIYEQSKRLTARTRAYAFAERMNKNKTA